MAKWIGIIMLLLSGCTSLPDDITPVDNFELPKYLGTWYEVARLDHSFERGMSAVTATYSMREDGGVKVLNRGFIDAEQQWDDAQGKAYFVDGTDVGHLKVSFLVLSTVPMWCMNSMPSISTHLLPVIAATICGFCRELPQWTRH